MARSFTGGHHRLVAPSFCGTIYFFFWRVLDAYNSRGLLLKFLLAVFTWALSSIPRPKPILTNTNHCKHRYDGWCWLVPQLRSLPPKADPEGRNTMVGQNALRCPDRRTPPYFIFISRIEFHLPPDKAQGKLQTNLNWILEHMSPRTYLFFGCMLRVLRVQPFPQFFFTWRGFCTVPQPNTDFWWKVCAHPGIIGL